MTLMWLLKYQKVGGGGVYTRCDTLHTQLIYHNLHSHIISTYSDTILGSLCNSTRYKLKLSGGGDNVTLQS